MPALKNFFAHTMLCAATVSFALLGGGSAHAETEKDKEKNAQAVTVFHNLNGYTFSGEPGENAVLKTFQVLAVKDGRVVAIGDEELLEELVIDRRYDLRGRTVLPGLIDSHGHILSLGSNLIQVDLRDLTSRTHAVAAVANYAHAHQDLNWILGRGWNQELWPDRRFPSRNDLDEVISDRPVWLVRVDAHAGWANSKALELAGINKDTIDPPGGQIIRDSEGNPTGVLIDTAMQLVQQVMPPVDEEQLVESAKLAFAHILELGITQVHDAGVNARELALFKRLAENDELPVRLHSLIAASEPALPELVAAGPYRSDNDRLQVRGVKVYGDGALGSRGAALIEPYSDDEENTGLLVTPEEQVKAIFELVHNHGFQINYHAIGDYTNRLALDEFSALLAEEIGADDTLSTWKNDPRHRVEHAQIVRVEDIPRFLELGIIPSMQPTHATSDMNMAEDRVGSERIAGAYAWRTFLDQGSLIAAGSDFPVELANPFYGIHAAVTRQDRENQPVEGWYPEQRMTVHEAIRSFTIDAAYAGHFDDVTGTLEAGKWADFIIVDQDPFAIDASDLWRIRVLHTFVGGDHSYRRQP